MTNKDDQEPGEEQLEISDDLLNSPPFDYGELKGTSETESVLESSKPETEELDDTDAEEIIDISDEEAQQEFEEMEREEQEASKNTEASKEAELTELELDDETQAKPVESSIAEKEEIVQKENNAALDAEENPGSRKIDKLNPENDTRDESRVSELFSRKIIYAAVAAALSISAIVMVLIFTFDSEELATDSTAAIDEELFPFVTREPIVEAEQSPDEEEINPPQEIVDQEAIDELQVVEAETPVIDEQAEDTSPSEVEINLAETEIAEEDPAFTQEVSVAAEEIPAVAEVAENAENDLEEEAVIPEEAPIAAEEELPTVAEVAEAASEAVSNVREESPVVSAQIATDLATLSESSNNFYIIIASFNSEEMALKHTSTLPENEESPIIIPPFKQDSKYRVAIAGYETMAETQANISKYKSVYGDDIWPLRFTLANNATLLKERTGNTYVVISSFLTESSAQNHVNTLAATGVEPLIIPPFGQSRSYRVTIFNYETLAAAQQALPQHREKYGDDIWLLKY